jgi:hypothetical protein
MELDTERRNCQETLKELRKNDRRFKEVCYQAEEDRKSNARLQDLIEKLESKNKLYKRQLEDTEAIAHVNMSKLRKVQQELENVEERACLAESKIIKFRNKNRSTVSFGRFSPQVFSFFDHLSYLIII